MTQKRPYKNSKKSRTISYTSNRKNKVNRYEDLSKTKKIDNTVRIRIDEDRLNDSDSLDTSFLGKRIKEKAQVDKKIRDKILREKKTTKIGPSFFKKLFFLLGVFCIIIVVVLVIINYDDLLKTNVKVDEPIVEEETIDSEIVDDNYLFIGNFYLEDMNFDELEFYKPHVVITQSDLKTKDLLDKMKKDVYNYNPSHVFLQIGLDELVDDYNMDEIIGRYRIIIESIKENRPYAKIFVESLYPVDLEHEDYDSSLDNITNDMIIDYNEKLMELTNSLDITYIDLFNELSDGKKLKNVYTVDGIHLNSDGNKKVWKKLRKFVS